MTSDPTASNTQNQTQNLMKDSINENPTTSAAKKINATGKILSNNANITPKVSAHSRDQNYSQSKKLNRKNSNPLNKNKNISSNLSKN